MKNLLNQPFVLAFFLCFSGLNAQNPGCVQSKTRLIQSAYTVIQDYISKENKTRPVVKVVYFHAADKEPLTNWKERLNFTLQDVSQYYKEELAKYGIQSDGIPFEEEASNQIVFNLVQGSMPSQKYDTNSGQQIQQEIEKKLKGKIDFSKDHVLIINGLCEKRDNKSYFFHSPYFGTGSANNGLCQVADCELLDSRLLTDTLQIMTFSEMFVTNKTCHVAEFNSWYVGGIAHELGHVFGLPHDNGNPAELSPDTRSLMGQYGSRHYREYLWGKGQSSVFSTAGILQLISHPVFNPSEKSDKASLSGLSLDEITCIRTHSGIQINIDFSSSLLPYGAVALVRSVNQSEYFNTSFSTGITGNAFNFEFGNLPQGHYSLTCILLLPDGNTASFPAVFVVDNEGYRQEISLLGNSRVNIKKLHKKLLDQKENHLVEQKLKIIEDIINGVEATDLKTFTGNKIYLSDAKWEKANVGWESPARNIYSYENEAVFFLENRGRFYSKGIFAHSPSLYRFNLDGKWRKLSATVGIRDGAHIQGSARFTVIGDGKILYKSDALRVNQSETFELNVKNINTLELRAEGTEGHNHNSWAVWLNPLLEK